jgi:hypothetical protein
MAMLSSLAKTAFLITVAAVLLRAQDPPGRKVPSVTQLSTPVASVFRGRSNPVELPFRVQAGFHINSNKPAAEYLIPTTLKIDAPTDIMLGGITYPEGQEMSFAFAPEEKLSVYSRDFSLSVMVRPLASVLPGRYAFRGELKYQACDNAACYPPKKLPVRFEVKVVKPAPPRKKNPAQSPHVHN